MPTYNTIVIKGDFERRRKEGTAAAAITPGHLLDRDSNGKLIKHAGAGGKASPIFAFEDTLQGKGIDDAYASGNQVQYHYAQRGDEIYALLATGNNVNPTHYLVSNGDGTLKLLAAEVADGTLVGRPLESINNTSGAPVRIVIEVM